VKRLVVSVLINLRCAGNLVVTSASYDFGRPTDIANKVCTDSTRNEQVKTCVCRRAVESEVSSSDSNSDSDSGQFRLSDSDSDSEPTPTFSCISYMK